MRKYLSLFAAALLMTACQNDDATENFYSDEPIVFSALQADYATRAAGEVANTDALKASDQGFGVFACYTGNLKYEYTNVTSDYMYNQQVKWDVAHSIWNYSPVVYWPNNEGDQISFFAYAPYEGEPSADKCIAEFNAANELGDPWLVYVLAKNIDDQVDLLYGINETNQAPWYDVSKASMPKSDSKLTFTFHHALSCVGDEITLKPSTELLAKLNGYADVYIDKVVIDYKNLTSKAKLILNSKDTPYWKKIVSGVTSTSRKVELIPDNPSAALTATGLEFTDKGLFYIPLLVDDETPKAEITLYYRIKNNAGTEYEGTATSSFDLNMTADGIGKKQAIALTLTENLDLLHLVYTLGTNPATEPSYSKKH
jgi:hypothetical protein